jgi:hypothetical protein
MADEIILKPIGQLPPILTENIQGDADFALELNGVTYRGKLSAILNGEQSFDALSDTPDSKTGNEGKVLAVDEFAEDIEYVDTQNYDLVTGSTNNDKLVTQGYVDDITGGGIFDKIKLNPDSGVTLTEEGQIKWNDNFYTPEYNTGLGTTVTIGNIEYVVFYNDTGAEIQSGRTMHLLAGVIISGQLYPTFEYADPRDWEKVQGTLGMVIHNVPNNSLGLIADRAQEISADTSGVPAGVQLWIKPDGTGDFTEIKPQSPNIAISIGGSYDSDVNGHVFFNITSNINEMFDDAWDGSIIESFDFTVSSNGTTVTGRLRNADNTRKTVIQFSTGLYTIDTVTTPYTIELIPGTDANLSTNFVYIPESTKNITVSTSGWPTDEHAKVAEINLQSAATTQVDGGALGNQNVNDHIKTTGNNGHILHITEWIRKQFATIRKRDNSEASLDNTGGNGYINISAGVMSQLHDQILTAFSMPTDSIRVWNDVSGNKPKITNLTSVTAYSDGSTWNNQWGKIVVWRVGNQTGEYSPVMFNLPSNGYNSEQSAIEDLSQYANYSIPDSLKTKAVLIGSFVFRISGGVITYNGGAAYEDLRGQLPIIVAGGSGGSGVSTLLALSDIFISDYTNKANQFLKVVPGENGADAQPNSNSIVFSATPTFNLQNGLVQEMPLTGNTVPAISNEWDGGTYIITFAVDATGGYSIAPDSSFGTITDNSIAPITSATANAVYIYTIVVRPGGTKFYTIESIGG